MLREWENFVSLNPKSPLFHSHRVILNGDYFWSGHSGLFFTTPHSLYPSQQFSARLPLWEIWPSSSHSNLLILKHYNLTNSIIRLFLEINVLKMPKIIYYSLFCFHTSKFIISVYRFLKMWYTIIVLSLWLKAIFITLLFSQYIHLA